MVGHSDLADPHGAHTEASEVGGKETDPPVQHAAHHVRLREGHLYYRLLHELHHVLSAGDLEELVCESEMRCNNDIIDIYLYFKVSTILEFYTQLN